MKPEAIIKRLNELDIQEEALFKERRKYIRMLTGGISIPPKQRSLSDEERASILNKRERTLLKRTTR